MLSNRFKGVSILINRSTLLNSVWVEQLFFGDGLCNNGLDILSDQFRDGCFAELA